MQINTAITEANKILMQYWPINAFIATNPLWSLRNKPFFEVASHFGAQALMSASYYHDCYKANKISNKDLLQALATVEQRHLTDSELQQWIDASLQEPVHTTPSILFAEQIDEYKFQKPTVWIKEHIFTLLRDFFGLNFYKKNSLLSYWQEQCSFHNIECCYEPEMDLNAAITSITEQLNIPETILVDYFEAIYLQVYGWTSLMNWRNHYPDNPWLPGEDSCEVILLLWLSFEFQIAKDNKTKYHLSNNNTANNNNYKSLQQRYIWQVAFEFHYLNQLDEKLNLNFTKEQQSYDAQFIFCIDTRSEGFRRNLEKEGRFETFGFAGFFGAIFNLKESNTITYQAPALVCASHTMKATKKTSILGKIRANLKAIMSFSKKQYTAPFALFEIAGFLFLPFMLFKNLQPKLNLHTPSSTTKIDITFSEDEQYQAAYNLLASIGLVSNFAKYVFICAHQSDNINNPFKASLNCGACGGNSGIPNAIVMTTILNKPDIRAKLADANIEIPDGTQFIAACHHTGDDRLAALDGEIPEELLPAIERAANNLRHEKSNSLPGNSALAEREQNWSELIPELGLINNTSIIIGPRKLTQGKDLERRAFLHSYDPKLDPDAAILTTILSAPAIVAHWISSQYYFSTVNPTQFGAGNKAIHNVLPGVGVLEGNLSDLKIGLPLQSTHFKAKAIHEPRRIIVVVYASKATLDKAIAQSPDFKTLLDNQWIYLKHIESA